MATKHNYARSGYIVTDAVLATLAKEYVAGVDQAEGVRGTYLRILVAHSKRALEERGVKRATTEIALEAVTAAHDALYPVILKAVTTPDVAPDEDATAAETRRRTLERNRRTTFARTSKATLTRAIEAGERLAALDPTTVTKEQLQARYAQVRAGPGTAREKIARLWGTLETQLRELAKEDEDAARAAIREMADSLEALFEEPGPERKPTKRKQVTQTRKRVGDLILHPHH